MKSAPMFRFDSNKEQPIEMSSTFDSLCENGLQMHFM